MPDTVPFSDREKDTLQRFGFPTHSIYSRGVAEKDDVTSMGMPFYKYRVFKNPNSYILTKRKYSSERERPIGDEKRVGKSDNLKSLLNRSPLSESNATINKNTMKLTENKLRNIIREELQKLAKKQQVNELSFREDKMRELLTREPKLDRIRQEEGHSLKTMFDMYVVRNKEMKRQYKQASPQS